MRKKSLQVWLDQQTAVFTAAGVEVTKEIRATLLRHEQARRQALTAPATAARIAAERARIDKGLAIAREHWGRPPSEISVREIAALAGLSSRTLYHHLGERTLAQEEQVHDKKAE